MTEDILRKYKDFRTLCLINAEDAISTAELLADKKVNHIAFQLLVLGLEEIGKVFVGWYNLNNSSKQGEETFKIPIDDHVKKLFWAIWGPTFGNEKFTPEQMTEIKSMATNLHEKRLDVMYTDLNDTNPCSYKISDEQLSFYLKMIRSRLEMAKLEGEVNIAWDNEQEADINWFMEATNRPDRRNFIFNNQSQEKLIELGNIKDWISWLKEYYKKEETELNALLENELKRNGKKESDSFEPKWKIRIKLHSPSHSIRSTVLDKFNKGNPYLKFSKGGGTNNLHVDLILDKSVPVQGIWNQGWIYSKILTAALNVGTNGLFYWNIATDVDKFYEKIWDLETNRQLSVKLKTSLQLDWSSRQMVLVEEELVITFMTFRYFSMMLTNDNFNAINDYMTALGMLAKNDMHLRLEKECFLLFFSAFEKALKLNEIVEGVFDIREVGYKQLENVIIDRTEYDKTIDFGLALREGASNTPIKVTLTEIISIKQYSGLYFATLAVRHLSNDKNAHLTRLN